MLPRLLRVGGPELRARTQFTFIITLRPLGGALLPRRAMASSETDLRNSPLIRGLTATLPPHPFLVLCRDEEAKGH